MASQATDPGIYSQHHRAFEVEGLPKDGAGWVARAAKVAAILAADGAARDKANLTPRAEIALLKSSGLLKVIGPTKYGGGGQTWEVGYKVIRGVAEGDGSIGMLLGYHLLWSYTANVVGTPEQQEKTQKLIIENNYFVGGAVNPRDSDLTIRDDGDHIVFNGFKNFNTGGVISDVTVLEGVYQDTTAHIFALAPTNQPGIQFAHNWNNIGMRLTESGSVKIENIRVPWSDALGWDPAHKAPRDSLLASSWATMLLPTIQLVFSNFYIGVAKGALDQAVKYVTSSTRPWPYTPHPADSAKDEFYILERVGNFTAHLRAAEALADRAGKVIADIYVGRQDSRKLNPDERGDAAEWVASVKIVATDTALRVTSGILEVMGAKATSAKLGADRWWRDVRTHTLHDPVAYKNTEVGRWRLTGEPPAPSWYT